jgi:hypothetical protein
MNYVPLFLAALIIAKNPDVFNFNLPSENIFCLDTVSVSDCIELSTISQGIGIPLDTLTSINPHILPCGR